MIGRHRITLFSLALLAAGCEEDLFDTLGDHLAAPISVAVDAVNARAYVVNSNTRLEFDGASLSILDLTDPTTPVLLANATNPISLPNFSGQIYFDAAAKTAFIPNRLSDSTVDVEDTLLRVNLDEASPSFGTVDTFNAGDDPFGAFCCDTSGRLYVTSPGGGTLDVYDPDDPSTLVQISLALTLSDSTLVSGRASTEGVILGNQAFVTNRSGRIYVINTSEVGNTALNPIDYIILEGGDLRGIATDGTLLYVVDASEPDNDDPILRVINPATLTAIDPDASTPTEVDISTLQTATVALGDEPNEIVLFGGRAYVTNRDSDSVSVIDLASNTAVTTIAVGDEPYGLAAFTAGGANLLYVTNLVSNSLSIINLDTNQAVSTFAP